MRRPLGTLVLSLVLLPALALTACGGDDGGRTTIDHISLEHVQWQEDLSCGFGFGTVDSSDYFRLTVHHSGERSDPLPRSVQLPDPAWAAEVASGKHLAANWCSDLIVEPEAEVAMTWRVVEGTLTFEGAIPALSSSGGPVEARARLTGVVIEDADGERTALADVSLRNVQWGWFAG